MDTPLGQIVNEDSPQNQLSEQKVGGIRRIRKYSRSFSEIPSNEITPKVESAMTYLMGELDRLKDELKVAKERVVLLENIADEDSLVDVLNRRGFVRELDRIISYASRYKINVCVLYIDLDGFKKINDTYGHKVGDLALRHIGDFLTDNVRNSDVVARIGGDEFAIILQQANLETAFAKVQQFEEKIKADPVVFDGGEITMSLSVGCAQLKRGETSAEIMDRADQEMYSLRAKRRS